MRAAGSRPGAAVVNVVVVVILSVPSKPSLRRRIGIGERPQVEYSKGDAGAVWRRFSSVLNALGTISRPARAYARRHGVLGVPPRRVLALAACCSGSRLGGGAKEESDSDARSHGRRRPRSAFLRAAGACLRYEPGALPRAVGSRPAGTGLPPRRGDRDHGDSEARSSTQDPLRAQSGRPHRAEGHAGPDRGDTDERGFRDQFRCGSNLRSSEACGETPTTRSTIWPPLKSMSVGIDMMP